MKVVEMTEEYAQIIANWRYPKPYDLYNMTADQDTLDELMDGTYFSVKNEEELIGYFCYGEAAQVPGGRKAGLYEKRGSVDIGLGLRPDLTGKGRGLTFIKLGMDYWKKKQGTKSFRLSVATFNTRAIAVYERAGFLPVTMFWNGQGEKGVEFLLMEKEEFA